MMAAAGQLSAAFDDAIAVLGEFEGAPIELKLERFGVDADELHEVLKERWATYAAGHDEKAPELTFVKGLVEGLLAGLYLKGRLES